MTSFKIFDQISQGGSLSRRRSLGFVTRSCPTTPKNLCVGGYQGGETISKYYYLRQIKDH